jgi:ribosome maturation factor RimP
MSDQKKTPFYFIEPYAKSRNIRLDDLAKQLQMADRTLRNKISRKTQFTIDEINELSRILQTPIAELFKTVV